MPLLVNCTCRCCCLCMLIFACCTYCCALVSERLLVSVHTHCCFILQHAVDLTVFLLCADFCSTSPGTVFQGLHGGTNLFCVHYACTCFLRETGTFCCFVLCSRCAVVFVAHGYLCVRHDQCLFVSCVIGHMLRTGTCKALTLLSLCGRHTVVSPLVLFGTSPPGY